MVFNATFTNISDISWRSILLVVETGVPGENYRPAASNYKMYIHNVHRSTISQSVKPLWYTSISCHKQLLLTLINTCNRRVVLFSSILFNTSFIYLHEWVSNCCLTLNEHFFFGCYIIARTSSISMKWWWWYPLCSRTTWWVAFYSASSL